MSGHEIINVQMLYFGSIAITYHLGYDKNVVMRNNHAVESDCYKDKTLHIKKYIEKIFE